MTMFDLLAYVGGRWLEVEATRRDAAQQTTEWPSQAPIAEPER